MALDLAPKTRWFSLGAVIALVALGPGCTSSPDDHAVRSSDDSPKDDITHVNHSKVKRQSIGNCWIYAVTGWLEALEKEATNQEKNTSESWLTYWHWFEQIANGGVSDELTTGGSYATAADLIVRYGLTLEGDFIRGERDDEMSMRQKTALEQMNASLASGALSDAAAREDRKTIRSELDRAWQLDRATIARIDAVFGQGVERTLDDSPEAVDAAPASEIIVPGAFPARLRDPQSGEFVRATLADAIGRSDGWFAPRLGRLAFQEVAYPSSPEDRREFWKRVQRALHDQIPVVMSWKVDFNALTRDARFSKAELDRRGPGQQGGHMTVMHDYEAEVPGIGLLKAGQQATPEQMRQALSDGTRIHFVRVKNSWGGIRPERWDTAVLPGYHDLEIDYLNGPIKECAEGAAGARCSGEVTPLWDVVLPAGY